jgi:biopolymer transport protein ExbB
MNIVELFDKGGALIYPLAVLFVWGLVIIVGKLVTLRRETIINPDVVEQVEKLIIDNNIPEATARCKKHSVPMTRILLAAIINYEKSEPELKEIVEEAGRQELPKIQSHLATLGTIASVAPLLGLLGTVIGMISVFSVLSQQANVDATMLAGGISEALVTTAFGMAIAMPTLAFYNYFMSKMQIFLIEIEKISLHMIAVLKRS